MNPIKLNITFLLARSRLNQAGKCSIRCRITYFKSRHEFATGLFINPNHWNSKLQQAKPPNEDNNYINTQISLIKQKINQAFLYLQVNNETIVVEDIYKQYKGDKLDKELGLIEVYNQYNQRIKKLIGIEIKLVTYNKYLELPSEADITLTKSIGKCADLLEINLFDHLIITKNGFYSFSNEGKLS